MGLLIHAVAMDIDTGKDAVGASKMIEDCEHGAVSTELHGWVRLRGITGQQTGKPESGGLGAEIEQTRQALKQLRLRGLKTCVMLRWPGDWQGRNYLPKDLREAHENGRKLGAAYGDLVDAWEVDNEPDLGFVPEAAENYVAFLKATYLGIWCGIAETKVKPETGRSAPRGDDEANLKSEGSGTVAAASHFDGLTALSGSKGSRSSEAHRLEADATKSSSPSGPRAASSSARWAPDSIGLQPQPDCAISASRLRQVSSLSSPLVLMAPLGLPPGPWLERFAANDGFSYTDAFNYHYYGYAEDFTSVYQQHERAVTELTTALLKAETGKLKAEGSDNSSKHGSTPQLSAFSSQVSPTFVQKNLPVFLTEVGYGMLGKGTRDTKEGRLRQWRWFKSVGEQVASLRIEAPMAFYLPPYLEYDMLEFGLTMRPSAGRTEDGGRRTVAKTEGWTAGGIEYTPEDFAEPGNPQLSGFRSQVSPSPWMQQIGKVIGGNEVTPALAWWFAARGEARKPAGSEINSGLSSQVSGLSDGSRSWSVTTVKPSPIVIDFINGEGLSFVKRYNGSFVVGRSPRTAGNAEGSKRTPLPPEDKPEAPSTLPRKEEFIILVRAANGNLYEVYPKRPAMPDWQTYSESQGNFTMAFYGRAELPWRFQGNRPASLVVVMYPTQLPATYEFRRLQLLRIGEMQRPEAGRGALPEDDEASLRPDAYRYGQGKVVLYNFSDREISGRLLLPAGVECVDPDTLSGGPEFRLMPNERREVPVLVKVPGVRFKRFEALIRFVPDDPGVPPARFLTVFMPGIGGMKATVVAGLLPPFGTRSVEPGPNSQDSMANNRSRIVQRRRATEEAPMLEQGAGSVKRGADDRESITNPHGFAFAQQGAKVERTPDGFTVTVSETPPGKQQRVEVEIPWPEGLGFDEDEFLSLDHRLGNPLKP